MPKQPPAAPTASAIGHWPTIIQIRRAPWNEIIEGQAPAVLAESAESCSNIISLFFRSLSQCGSISGLKTMTRETIPFLANGLIYR